MDPFTIALATFGIQKLRGKSTKRSLRDAAIAGGLGQLGGMAGVPGMQAFGQAGSAPAMFQAGNYGATPLGGIRNLFAGPTEMYKGVPFNKEIGLNQLETGGSQAGNFLQDKIIGSKDVFNPKTGELIKEGSGFMGLSPGAKLGIGAAATTALAGDTTTISANQQKILGVSSSNVTIEFGLNTRSLDVVVIDSSSGSAVTKRGSIALS